MRWFTEKGFNYERYIEIQKQMGQKPDWYQCQECYAFIGVLGRVMDRVYRILTFGLIKHLHRCNP